MLARYPTPILIASEWILTTSIMTQHDFIPNLSIADIIQLINRLDLLSKDPIRRALKLRKPQYKFGVELDSRRKIDFDVSEDLITGEEEIKIHYMDPLREISRFEIGRIDTGYLSELIEALKETFVEYVHLLNKSLILRESF